MAYDWSRWAARCRPPGCSNWTADHGRDVANGWQVAEQAEDGIVAGGMECQQAEQAAQPGERADDGCHLGGAVQRLGQRLEAAVEPASALPLTVDTVACALRLPYVAIALKGEDGRLDPVGEQVAGSRAAHESLTQADQRLLQDLARQSGVAAHAALLAANLEQARLRLVTERGEARRRLGSDLHDGVGHQLVALTRLVERALTTSEDPSAVHRRLEGINHRLVELTRQVRENEFRDRDGSELEPQDGEQLHLQRVAQGSRDRLRQTHADGGRSGSGSGG
jgi:hypothetical protein